MPFSSDMKKDLCRITMGQVGMIKNSYSRIDDCCSLAFLRAVLIYAGRPTDSGYVIRSENSDLLELCAFLLIKYASVEATVIPVGRSSGYRLSLPDDKAAERLISSVFKSDLSPKEVQFTCENCFGMFLRGAFLGCGTVLDPGRGYHLELVCADTERSKLISGLIKEHGFEMKSSARKSNSILYLKGSDSIEDFLIRIGAQKYALRIMELKVEREVRNNETRLGNSLVANLDRSVKYSVESMKAIEKLKSSGRFNSLSDELRETAALRERFPNASLSELCARSGGSITKSGLNHRLRKLISLASELTGSESERKENTR